MAKNFWRKKAFIAKAETTYGTDSAPTAVANAIQMSDVSITPIDGEEVSRDLYRPYLGAQEIIPVGLFGRIEGSVEIAGAGAAGTAPGWGVLHRGCGMAETIIAATSVGYTFVSGDQEALTFKYWMDGIQHVLLGARGTWRIEITPKSIPRWRYTFTGLLGQIADVALPSPTLTAFKKPVTVGKANTSFSLHGISGAVAPVESFSIDAGNVVEKRDLIGEESVIITDRATVGQVVAELAPIATKDWFAAYQNQTLGAQSIVHGTAAGNIVEFSAPNVQIGKPTYGNTQGISNITLPTRYIPGAGNDELTILVR